jgi:hypothetical protein
MFEKTVKTLNQEKGKVTQLYQPPTCPQNV